MDDPVPYQALYRRFRPQRFDEVLGQPAVTTALRNAVREGRVGHGYLFSGPRGTGKTSTARILAKALNCEKLDDGEPCGVCDSCVSVQQGNSFAVFEMDAASNRGIDAVRDLIQRIALGSPGQRKVYIIDEVHHLTNDAATALLKTLEEPPGHVVFVLATTDPQKVLPTIKSRVQHYDFHLLQGDVLQELVTTINVEAGLGLETDDLKRVVRRGAGSARDALSVLDQAAALGSIEAEVPVADEVAEAMCEREPARALEAVAAACANGRDPRRMGEEILAHLRDVFLASRAPSLVDRPADEVSHLDDQARRLGVPALVRAMERLGEALTEMREALDPRVSLEVALVRVTAAEADTSVAALLERVDRLERRLSAGDFPAQGGAVRQAEASPPQRPGGPPPAQPLPGAPASGPAEATTAEVAPRADRSAGGIPDGIRRARSARGSAGDAERGVVAPPPEPPRGALGAYRRQPSGQSPPQAPPGPPTASEPPSAGRAPDGDGTTTPPDGPVSGAGPGALPGRDELTIAWADHVLPVLRGRAKALFAVGRFVEVTASEAVFALPNEAHRSQCAAVQRDVEEAIAGHVGRRVPLRLVVEPDAAGEGVAGAAAPGEAGGAGTQDPDDEVTAAEVREMREAPAAPDTPEERVKLAFPGATEVEQ